MDARENSKLLQQQPLGEQEQCQYSPYHSYPSISLFSPNPQTHFSNLYQPLFSTMDFNELKNERANRGNSFTPSEASSVDSDVLGEHSCAKSDTDSCSEGGDDVSDEVSLDELLHDGKAKKKIELLAAMVGVDSTEPAMVLTEVVRVLKHLKRINQF